jgi:hypothetical protein
MSLNATMLTEHKYWHSMQCKRTIWMHHEASSDSGKTNNRMQVRSIEVQLAMNWHAGDNPMSAIAGSPYFNSNMYFRNCLFFTRAFIKICSSCTLGIGRWRKSDIVCSWFVTNFRRSRYALLSKACHSDSISSSSPDGNRFTQSNLRHGFLEAQTYKLVKM